MKRRILTAMAAFLCAVTLISSAIAPVHAYAPTDGDSGTVSPQTEEIRIYYRVRDGVREMRIWSLTRQVWITEWVPVPEGWGS